MKNYTLKQSKKCTVVNEFKIYRDVFKAIDGNDYIVSDGEGGARRFKTLEEAEEYANKKIKEASDGK